MRLLLVAGFVGEQPAYWIEPHQSILNHYPGCIAGALTVSELTRLLEAAGFEDIDMTIEHRYHSTDFLGDLPPALSNLPAPVLNDLIQRFASSSIQARKPRR